MYLMCILYAYAKSMMKNKFLLKFMNIVILYYVSYVSSKSEACIRVLCIIWQIQATIC